MRLRGRKQPVKVIDNIPSDYEGSIYYRLLPNRDVVEKMRFELRYAEDERNTALWDRRNWKLGRVHFGLIADEWGELRPEFQRPFKAMASSDEEPDCHFVPGGTMTDWAKSIVEELDPVGHFWLPVDVERPSGGHIRLWRHIWGGNFLPTQPYLTDPVLNQMEPVTYTDGTKGYHKPRWACGGPEKHDFGYLVDEVIGGRNLLASNNLDNGSAISSELYDRLSAEVNSFRRAVTLCPVGVV